MSMSDGSPQPTRLTLQSLLGAQVYGLLVLATNISFGAAGVGALWLLAALIFGNYAQATAAMQQAALGNIGIASTMLTVGLAVGAVLSTVSYYGDEVIGYYLLGGAIAIGVGVQFAFQQFGGENFAEAKSIAIAKIYTGFAAAALLPAIVGAILIGFDVVRRIFRMIRERPTVVAEKMAFGTGAKKETDARPPRTSILGKCWEGPYCREFIRVACPIFLKRQACWKQRAGCYCEEDIVSAAASKINGTALPVLNSGPSRFANAPATQPSNTGFLDSPEPSLAGFSSLGGATVTGRETIGRGGYVSAPLGTPAVPRKIELTNAQKAERCRSCVIYNEHQREKYQLLLPIVIIGSLTACAFLTISFHTNMGVVITGFETVVNHFSFLPGSSKVTVGDTSGAVTWVLAGAVTIMVTSKMLQLLEWCIFKIKI